MKIKITKSDFSENGGKLFLSYLENISSWESKNKNPSLLSKNGRTSPKMKPGKVSGVFNASVIKLFNSKIDAMRNLKLLTEQIAAKILSDSGITLNGRSLEAAKKKIQKTFISTDSAKQNFDVEIEFDSETGHCTLEHKGLSSKNAGEEKPKLELDQSMEFDADPESAEVTTGSESMDKGEMKPEILEETKAGQSELTDAQGEKSSNHPKTEAKCNLEAPDASKSEADVEMKPESLPETKSEEEKPKDMDVPLMGQSSPYSPSKLSDCLRNEDVQKSPDSDLNGEIRYLSKISDESKVSWTSFLDGAQSVPSSPSMPLEDKHQKSSEENHPKNEESDAMKREIPLQPKIEETAETLGEDSVEAKIETKEKRSGPDSSEQSSNKHDVFLPEDVSSADGAKLGSDGQMATNQNKEMFLDDITGMLSAPAQINE